MTDVPDANFLFLPTINEIQEGKMKKKQNDDVD